jgi:hypothetical protein
MFAQAWASDVVLEKSTVRSDRDDVTPYDAAYLELTLRPGMPPSIFNQALERPGTTAGLAP